MKTLTSSRMGSTGAEGKPGERPTGSVCFLGAGGGNHYEYSRNCCHAGISESTLGFCPGSHIVMSTQKGPAVIQQKGPRQTKKGIEIERGQGPLLISSLIAPAGGAGAATARFAAYLETLFIHCMLSANQMLSQPKS